MRIKKYEHDIVEYSGWTDDYVLKWNGTDPEMYRHEGEKERADVNIRSVAMLSDMDAIGNNNERILLSLVCHCT